MSNRFWSGRPHPHIHSETWKNYVRKKGCLHLHCPNTTRIQRIRLTKLPVIKSWSHLFWTTVTLMLKLLHIPAGSSITSSSDA
jgi:hypothetical protein